MRNTGKSKIFLFWQIFDLPLTEVFRLSGGCERSEHKKISDFRVTTEGSREDGKSKIFLCVHIFDVQRVEDLRCSPPVQI
jgi:hypothetical protein